MLIVSNGFDVRGRALQRGELAAWLAEHSLGNRFGLAVVGTTPAYDSRAVALAIVAADGDGRYIDTAALTPDDEAALVSWLADPGPPKAVHDAKLAMHALAGRGWTLRGVTSDAALAAHLVRPEHRSTALNDLLVHHMRCALSTEPTETIEVQRFSSLTHPGGPDEQAVQALILRACAVLDLTDLLDEELARIDSSSLLGRLELPVQRVLREMETVGVAVDRALLGRIHDQLDEDATRLKHTVDGLLNSIASDGRIHTTFQQTSAATGRLSTSKPELHNIPIELYAGRRIRDAFVAGDGYAELMTAGYGQLETRILAHLSGHACLDDARRIGYASTLSGRRRYLPELNSRDAQVREVAERNALATCIEGSAADIIKMAMINVNQAITDAGLKSRMLLQVDDELVFEVAEWRTRHVGSAYPRADGRCIPAR